MGILFWEIMFFDYSAEQFDQRESFGRKEKKGKLLQSESLLASDVAGAGATHTHIYIVYTSNLPNLANNGMSELGSVPLQK